MEELLPPGLSTKRVACLMPYATIERLRPTVPSKACSGLPDRMILDSFAPPAELKEAELSGKAAKKVVTLV